MSEPMSTMQFQLGPFLNPDRILIFRGRHDKTEILNAMIDTLAEIPEIDGRDDLARGIFHRESLMTTSIGNGIAVPHVRILSLDEIFLSVAICPDGIPDYFTVDSMPVCLAFLIVSGKKQSARHVKLLSRIGKLFFDGRLKAAFLAAKDAQTCIETISRAEAAEK